MKKSRSSSSPRTSNHSTKGTKNLANEASGSAKSIAMDKNKLLLDAVISGKEMLVQNLIQHGVSLSYSDQFGCHPLYYAACYNYENILKILLKKGRNLVDRPTKMLRTPLQIAAYHGHANIVRILVQHNADVDLVDTLGMSALHWAAENNHARIVRILLEAGANQSLINKFGKTAFCLASARKNYSVCEVLQDLDMLSDIKYLSDGESSGKEKFNSSQSAKEKLQESETIKLFEQHGIKLLPVDDSTIICNALKRGKTAVLTEAGKLALKKTEPEFLRTISNMSNTASNAFTQMSPPKKMRVDNCTSSEPAAKPTVEKKTNSNEKEDETKSHKPKVIKIDAKELTDLISRKKLVICRPSRTSTVTMNQKQVDQRTPAPNSRVADCPARKPSSSDIAQLQSQNADCSAEKSTSSDLAQLQLQNQTNLLKDMQRQLGMSMRLTDYYKNKYEMKEREAELYKTQLVNLSTVLTNSGFQINIT